MSLWRAELPGSRSMAHGPVVLIAKEQDNQALIRCAPGRDLPRPSERSRMSNRVADVGFEPVICTAAVRPKKNRCALRRPTHVRALMCANSTAPQGLQAIRPTDALRFAQDELGRRVWLLGDPADPPAATLHAAGRLVLDLGALASSASEQFSSTPATASRACCISGCNRHSLISTQSAHWRNRVRLAHGVNASGPSNTRMTSATETVAGSRSMRWPPCAPRRLSMIP
jgi:hypothetical protein